MRPRTRLILVCTAAVLVAVGATYAGLWWMARSFGLEETNDVAAYSNTLTQWSGSGLVSHFPASIPPQARNVRFAAFPAAMQGGAYIQLRMQLPESDVAALQAQFEKATTHVYVGGGFFDHYNEDPKNNWPATTFRTSDNPQTTFDFPPHYTLYVLSATDRSGGSWNHGETSGAAVSTSTNEVVYWADSW